MKKCLMKMAALLSVTLLISPITGPTVALAQEGEEVVQTSSLAKDWVAIYQQAQEEYANLEEVIPDVVAKQKDLEDLAFRDGALTAKQKVYAAVAIVSQEQSEVGIVNTAMRAHAVGMTHDELGEIIAMLFAMGGEPVATSGARVLAAYDALGEGLPDEVKAAQEEYQAKVDATDPQALDEGTEAEYNQEISNGWDWDHISATSAMDGKKRNQLQPEFAQGFTDLYVAGTQTSLSDLDRECAGVALAIQRNCDVCTMAHIGNFLKYGGTRRQLAELLEVNRYLGGGPVGVTAGRAIDCYDYLKKKSEEQAEEADTTDESSEEESQEALDQESSTESSEEELNSEEASDEEATEEETAEAE